MMNHRIFGNWIRGVAMALAGLTAMLLPGFGALATDRVTLKDGTVYTGEVTKELDGYIFFNAKVGGIDRAMTFSPAQITKLERDIKDSGESDANTKSEASPTIVATPVAAAPSGTPSGGRKVPKAAVITLGGGGDKDMVGVYMTAETLRRAIPELERELGTDKSGVVVFRVNSGGGMLLEIQKLSDVIHNEYKPRFRVVAWIHYAISAAAMTSHCIEEIYFTSQGSYGACTGWFGQLQAVKGLELEEVLESMRKISARGNHDPKIMRSMQIQEPLSATIDANGDVHYFQDLTSGDIIVNREKEILTFDDKLAAKVKFSRGTADTLEELTKLMGYQELEWVGERVKDVPWPVCRAEKMQMDYRDQVKRDEDNTNNYWASYQRALEAARAAQTRDDRGLFVGRARAAFNNLKNMVKNNPNFRLTIFNMLEEQWKDFVDEQEKIMRDLMR